MPREREVIEKRYLTDAPMQLAEIGEDFGVSKQRVSQIERRAIGKLREYMKEAA